MTPNFPGMNPYLEHPELWTEVHSWLIVELARFLNPLLVPKYRVAVEKRVYSDSLLIGIPDVSVFQRGSEVPTTGGTTSTLNRPIKVTVPTPEEVRESYLEIREIATGQVITVIEVLSPTNKRSGEGRNQYNIKRLKILSSPTNLVEIDLLRSGDSLPIAGGIESDYRILVSRATLRPEAELYPFNLRDPIPVFPVPLQSADVEPLISLQEILQQVYQSAALDLAIDYLVQPVPPLSNDDFEWVQTL